VKSQDERNLVGLALKRCNRIGVMRVAGILVLLAIASGTSGGSSVAEIAAWTQLDDNNVSVHCKHLRGLGLLEFQKGARGDKRETVWTLTPAGHDLITGRL